MSYDVNPIIDRLCETFPVCFNRSTPKPLRIGLGEEVMALAGVHPALTDLSRTMIRRSLKVYTGSFAYRKAVAAGGPRYGLDGQPAGEVTPDQQAFAKTPRKKPEATTSPGSDESTSLPPSPAPKLPPIDRMALLQEIIAMAIPGKLDVTLKINELPQAKPASAQTMLFAVQADGRTVVVEVKNKMWNNLKAAAENYPQWVAAITGKMGEGVKGGFRLENPAVQVFEKKLKLDAAATPAEPKAPVPQLPPAPAPPPAPAAPLIDRPKLSLKGRSDPPS
ncbi:MAG: ProQ/FINO family protein [Candidatus Contendobacter sp.]|jgi:hypothetical protein|nr:hypothetical protein [Gammaproteobacteria bacterium]MCC8993198.1 ProQ/FINO family protein [Candidatus Contendobacter sp.]